MRDSERLTEIILMIFRLNGRIIEWGDRLSGELGLTSARWQVLGAIALAGVPQTVPEIADRMGVTRQATQKQVNLLEGEGLVRKRANPRHRRSQHYLLTEAGESAYQSITEKYESWAREAVAGAPAGILEGTIDGLSFLAAKIAGVEGDQS